MPANAFVTVERFPDAIAAELARAKLESAGISAHLADDLTVSVDWQLTTAIGGIRLQVATEQAAEARAVLREFVPPMPTDEGEVPVARPNSREKLAERAALCALIGLLLPPFLLYGAWLMMVVSSRKEPLRTRSRRQLAFGVALILAWLAVLIAVMSVLLFRATP